MFLVVFSFYLLPLLIYVGVNKAKPKTSTTIPTVAKVLDLLIFEISDFCIVNFFH
jgi:hypothetical protein